MKKYSKTLVDYLQRFCGEDEKGEYLFTNGVIHLRDGLVATNRRLYIKYKVKDVPEALQGASIRDGVEVSRELNFQPLMFTIKPRPGKFILDYHKWDAFYEKVKKVHRPKSFGKSISPYECVKLCEGLYVYAKTFNDFVKVCQKEDIHEIKFNNTELVAENDTLTVVEVNYQKAINFDFDECQDFTIQEL